MNQVDLRKHSRKGMESKFFCKNYSTNGKINKFSPVVELQSLDISVGGMGLLSNKRINVFTIIMFRLPINNDVVDITGEVRYCNYIGQGKYKLGIQFKCLDHYSEKVIEEFLNN